MRRVLRVWKGKEVEKMDYLMRLAVKWCCFNVSIVVCRKHINSPTTIGRHHELGHLHSAFLKTSIHIIAKTMIQYVFKYAPKEYSGTAADNLKEGLQYQQPTNNITQPMPKTGQSCNVKLETAPKFACCNV